MRLGRERKLKVRPALELYVFICLIMLSFVSILFSSRNALVDIKGIGLTMFLGIRSGIDEVASTVSRTILSIQELANLRREFLELTDRFARYEHLERSAAEIRQENNRLRELLGFSQDLRYQHIPARLIGRDPVNLFSAFVINRGTNAGVEANMTVIAYHGGVQGLVGRVIHTGVYESLVMPLYDYSSYVSSRLAESRYDGIVEGRGIPEVPLLMRFISKRARDEINIGDMVISSGTGGIIPAGINIGRVIGINYQEDELSMEVELETTIDFSRLEYMFVIISTEEDND